MEGSETLRGSRQKRLLKHRARLDLIIAIVLASDNTFDFFIPTQLFPPYGRPIGGIRTHYDDHIFGMRRTL